MKETQFKEAPKNRQGVTYPIMESELQKYSKIFVETVGSPLKYKKDKELPN